MTEATSSRVTDRVCLNTRTSLPFLTLTPTSLSAPSYKHLNPNLKTSVSLHSDALGPNQACTLFGAQAGSDAITGRDYMRVGYSLDPADLWRRNLLVLIGFFVLFQLTQIMSIEFYPVSSFISCMREVCCGN